jgi:hypothetical protein
MHTQWQNVQTEEHVMDPPVLATAFQVILDRPVSDMAVLMIVVVMACV